MTLELFRMYFVKGVGEGLGFLVVFMAYSMLMPSRPSVTIRG